MNTIADVLSGAAEWTLLQTDCLSPEGLPSLPDRSVAHVITDPPYEAEAHTKARRNDKASVCADYEIDFVAITGEQRAGAAAQSVRLSRGWVLAFCQVEAVAVWRSTLATAGAQWRRGMAWVKPDSTPQFTGDRPAQGFECIAAAWAGDSRSRWNAGGKRGVYSACVNNFGRLTNGRPHPTMKPIGLMVELISDFTDPGDIILDPFAGSGTTGVACIRLGRRFIGMERDPKHAATAIKRLSAARRQEGLFDRVKVAAPKQLELGAG